MIRRRRRVGPQRGMLILSFFGCALEALALPREARAAANDAEAMKLRQVAIETDYLATDFASAETKLTQALALCKGAAACTATTRGRLHCDLGVVYFAEQNKDEANAQFAAAAKADPNVTVSPDLTTPELQKELAAAKSAHVEHAAPETAGPEKPAKSGTESDCPPGFPGCKGSSTGSGATCSTNDDCAGGETCQDRTCQIASGEASEATAPPKTNWLSIAAEEDFLFLTSANKVCAGGSGYTCFNGSAYDTSVPSPSASTSDSVSGGLAPATTRFLLGYDRALTANITVGARVGFAIGGGPTRPNGTGFLPIHAEARGTYWLGGLAARGFRFFVLAALGVAEVDSSLTAYVFDTGKTTVTTYDAWKKTGQGFAALGLGPMFAFSPNDGITLEVRAMELFPTSGTALGAQLGYVHGF